MKMNPLTTLTYKEIGEQPAAVKCAHEVALDRTDWVQKYFHPDVEQTIFIGSGSSYYQAQTMAAAFRSWLQRDAIALPSSDLLLIRKQVAVEDRKTVVIGVSRSGESTEVILALNAVKDLKDWQLAGVTCHETSEMARISECLVSDLGKEKSTVMTKSLSSMIMQMQTAAAVASGDKKLIEELASVVEADEGVVRRADETASSIVNSNDFNKTVFLGLGGLFGLAQEGCLKLKEMSNVWTESFGTLEFRHGPKSIVDDGTCIILMVSEQSRQQELKVAQEMKEYGAYVVVITSHAGADTAFADVVFEVGLPEISDESRSILYLPLLQYYGFYTAIKKGLDPDNPRNLTQVVKI
jgi:glucosamine--fructose-6-phosphate aminotransferase (isomerizing)